MSSSHAQQGTKTRGTRLVSEVVKKRNMNTYASMSEANFLTLIFFLKNLPLKDDELVMSEM